MSDRRRLRSPRDRQSSRLILVFEFFSEQLRSPKLSDRLRLVDALQQGQSVAKQVCSHSAACPSPARLDFDSAACSSDMYLQAPHLGVLSGCAAATRLAVVRELP